MLTFSVNEVDAVQMLRVQKTIQDNIQYFKLLLVQRYIKLGIYHSHIAVCIMNYFHYQTTSNSNISDNQEFTDSAISCCT